MSKPLIIFGTGDFARIARLYFEADGQCDVIAFCVDDPGDAAQFEGLPLLSSEALTQQHPPSAAELFLGVGYSKVNQVRAGLFERFGSLGYRFASYVHPSVTIWPGTAIGQNVMIFENNVVQPGVTLGDDVIVWSHNHIGHDVAIGDHVFISSEVCIAGHARVEDRCFLGINATIRDGIRIGEGCIIGAGALVLKDADANGVYLAEETPRHRLPANRLRGF